MVLAMFVTLLLLVIGLSMLSVSQYGALNAQNIERKQDSFNAAEAGLNTAVDKLDLSNGFSATGTKGTLANKYTFTYTIINNLSGNAKPATDPATGGTVTIPANRGLIVSTGKGPNGERPTTLEAVVKNTQTVVQFPNYAIAADLDLQGSWNHKIGIYGSSPGVYNANVHANHNITASMGLLQGTASASGTTDSLNTNKVTGTNTPQVTIPTAQMAPFVTNEKSIAQGGGAYALYVNPAAGGTLPSTFTCPSGAPSGCVVYYDGSLSISGKQTIQFSGQVTFVVNGSYTATGSSQISFQHGTKSLFVVNGNADDGGNGTMYALIWAKGDVTLHGNGMQQGAVVAGGNVNFNGGGANGGFEYDNSLANMSFNIPGHIVISAYGEY
jgi:hypothetical protein